MFTEMLQNLLSKRLWSTVGLAKCVTVNTDFFFNHGSNIFPKFQDESSWNNSLKKESKHTFLAQQTPFIKEDCEAGP